MASMSVLSGWGFDPGGSLSQKVRPTHGCLPFSSCQIRLPFSSLLPCLLFPSCCFHWARQTTPGPDSDDLISANLADISECRGRQSSGGLASESWEL